MTDEPTPSEPQFPPPPPGNWTPPAPPSPGSFPPIGGEYSSPPPGALPPPPSSPSFPPPPYGAAPQFPPPPQAPQYGAPQYGAPQYGPGPYPGAPPAAPKTNGLAIASLVTGIIGCFWITPILAIVFGLVARKQIRESNGRQTGAGLAIAGLVLGIVWVLLIAGFIVLGLTGQLDEDVPTRGEFVSVVSDELEGNDPSLAGLTPEQRVAAGAANDDLASCVYTVYVKEPALVNAVYEDPLADEQRIPGVSQSRIDELLAEDDACFTAYAAAVTSIVGG